MTNTVQKLAKQFVARAEALGLKGKKRDDAALDFFCGAASALGLVGNQDAEHVKTVTVLIVSIRGYFGVCEIANKE